MGLIKPTPKTLVEGLNLSDLHPGVDYWIEYQFTNHLGEHIIFNRSDITTPNRIIEVYSNDYTQREVTDTYNHLPYLGWGIDQNPVSKVMCYAEYNSDTAEEASIFRSTDNGKTWTPVLTVSANGASVPEIRHFHLVFKKPGVNNVWFASSGDSPEHCHVWKSTDDGLTWTKVVEADHRVRAVQYDSLEGMLYWSEDNVNGGIYRMDQETFVIEELIAKNVLSGLGYSFIRVPEGWVAFYSKAGTGLDPNNSHVYLIDLNFNHHLLLKDPSDFTAFKSRRASGISGYFYTYTTAAGKRAAYRMARGRIIKQDNVYGIDLQYIDGGARGHSLIGTNSGGSTWFPLEHRIHTNWYTLNATEEIYVVADRKHIFKSIDHQNFIQPNLPLE